VEEFLGILFAGGRGTRLGLITQYISKAFVPVYDRPVFMYPLAQLQRSQYIREILILTNAENDVKFQQTGYRTVIQDDSRVHDMLSGLRFLREVLKTHQHCVLMPCDNISNVSVDALVEAFLVNNCNICFSLTRVSDQCKLSQMGVYDPATGKLVYKPSVPPSEWGVIAPYVVNRGLIWNGTGTDTDVFNQARTCWLRHEGYWFDIGDPESLVGLYKHLSVTEICSEWFER